MPYNLEIDGWMNEIELQNIERLARTVPANGVIVEIGSWKGRSAAAWAASADPSVTVYCFDPFNRWDEFVENTAQFTNIVPVKGMVPIESTYTDTRKIDICFIDASHWNPSDWNIIEYFLPFIAVNGYIGGHDYTPYSIAAARGFEGPHSVDLRGPHRGLDYPDVNTNVHRLEEMFNQKAVVGKKRSGPYNKCWWLKKPPDSVFDTTM
jgi:hypothetical protein